MTTHRIRTDLLVIGAGSGGLSVAAGAAQMGADVTLLEGHKMGGDCLNYGCVPSKALIAAAGAAHGQAHTAAFGVAPCAPQVDYAAAMDYVAQVIGRIAPHDSVERFTGLGVRVIEEYGSFVSPREVEAGAYRIKARRVVIATGSSPFVPPIAGLDSVPFLTNETLFAQREQPAHLLVIGGGPIGMEMAQAHHRLGCKVSVIESSEALGREDRETAALALSALRSEGVEIFENTKVERVQGTQGAIEATAQDGRVFAGSHLLVAVGRRPSIDRLNLAAAGVEVARGAIKVGAGLRTSNRRVYAIGDVIGRLQFTHVASYHAGLVIRSALLGMPTRHHSHHIPRATYTTPEVAQVGLTESEAQAEYGDRLHVLRLPFDQNDRAITGSQTNGLVKLMVVKSRWRTQLVGVAIAGHQAGELINTWALVLANRLKLTSLTNTVAAYPTIGEINKRAAGAWFAPRLFQNPTLRRGVRLVQRLVP
ncbi:MAG: FAD-dependent oxidoreductase [Rhodobacteraceae bacterium]|nr:FAD-dependent oxidoreductase [Paracoccaceae bacterium]